VILHDRTLQTLVDKIFPAAVAPPPKRKEPQQAQKKLTSKPKTDSEDQVSFKVEPHGTQDESAPLEALAKPYLKTSGKLKVSQLRKYLARRLDAPVPTLELLCNDGRLPGEHSVHFIKRTLWTAPGDLVITYRVNASLHDV